MLSLSCMSCLQPGAEWLAWLGRTKNRVQKGPPLLPSPSLFRSSCSSGLIYASSHGMRYFVSLSSCSDRYHTLITNLNLVGPWWACSANVEQLGEYYAWVETRIEGVQPNTSDGLIKIMVTGICPINVVVIQRTTTVDLILVMDPSPLSPLSFPSLRQSQIDGWIMIYNSRTGPSIFQGRSNL